MKRTLSLFVGLVAAAATATAASVSYNINFTATTGTAPTSGSFSYDAATSTFSSFIVTWGTGPFSTYDLTARANSPSLSGACDTAAANSADFFAYLNGTNTCVSQQWSGFAGTLPGVPGLPPMITTNFLVGSQTSLAGPIYTIAATPASNPVPDSNGTFTISPAGGGGSATPEPSSWALMLGSGGALFVWRRRQCLAVTKAPRQN